MDLLKSDAPDCVPDGKERLRVRLTGAVQGVGFRPFVFGLANELGLAGTVDNNSSGLHIEVEGSRAALSSFLQLLRTRHPRHARILTWEAAWLPPRGYSEFRILDSDPAGQPTAAILPDLAPCPDCIREVMDDAGRRQGYPFTNCTQCGPRYTIVRSLPYDRANTSMSGFPLCDQCRREYEDPADRRFHAQPVACPACGPRLSAPIASAVDALCAGKIVALKGVGGYQLLVNSSDESAVLRLRERKNREWKPLAVMAPDLGWAHRLAEIPAAEELLLCSSAAPIVLLAKRTQSPLAPSVCGASPYAGVMLPSSPLHHLLLQAFGRPVVCTSGNRSDEPIATGEAEARERLASIADFYLEHDRPIERACDDSVARVTGGRTAVLRRARGFAPLPVPLRAAAPRILAVGGHLKSTVCLGVGRQAILSQHIGDLDTPEARAAFHRAIDDLARLYDFRPEALACDLHPDYYATQWAESAGLPLVRVQHHEAHALSCLLENDASGPALAVSWDGTGYGTDGTIWGSEFFLVDDGGVQRVAHLRPFPLAGGDAGARDCGRSAAGLLHRMGLPVEGPMGQVLARGTGCVETTSMGRLFDAVAWLLGLTWRNRYEGEAGLTLEAAASRSSASAPYPLAEDGDWSVLIGAVRGDIAAGEATQDIAARFHYALAAWVEGIALQYEATQVALSGGCFQNAFLTEAVTARLERRGIRSLTHQLVPPNDGGLALGQLAAAIRQIG